MTAPRLATLALLTSVFVAGATARAQQQPSPNSTPAARAAISKARETSPPARSTASTKATAHRPIKVTAARTPPLPSPMFVERARKVGFTLEHVRGVLLFCRTARGTGSRIPVTDCYRQEEMKLKLEAHDFDRNQLSDQMSNGAATIRN